jgi:ferredoxin
MRGFRYLSGVSTLALDDTRCDGCGMCATVCPHAVFTPGNGSKRRMRIADRDACMECGACVRNCQAGALSVQAGVGCATAIISSWLHRRDTVSCG